MNKLKLYGFNNLTKSLSFCIYNVCYAVTEEDRQSYIRYIDGQYNAKRLTQLLTEVCSMIGANILNIANQDYDPQGASVTILVSEEPIDPNCVNKSELPGPAHECPYNECPHLIKQNTQCSQAVVAHLDKSHICVHTYPESNPQSGICTFRVDIEVSTCGVISPLKALNYLIHQLESDIVTIDYRVRGFTRDVDGTKHYIDHEISSIQNFLSSDIREQYEMLDVNMPQENIFHTKMRLTRFELEDFLFNIDPDSLSEKEHMDITQRLKQEMQEIYSGRNLI